MLRKKYGEVILLQDEDRWLQVRIKLNPKNSHVHFMYDNYPYVYYFSKLIERTGCYQTLRRMFHTNRKKLHRESTLITGGSRGVWTYCPTEIALEAGVMLASYYHMCSRLAEKYWGYPLLYMEKKVFARSYCEMKQKQLEEEVHTRRKLTHNA